MADQVALLELRGIVKRFPGVTALSGVDFTLRGGEIHALMGENGAGKSTLIKVLTGVYPKDGGAIRLGGVEIQPKSPLHAQTLGISTVYQEVNLIPYLSVAENVFLGRQPRRLGSIDWRATNRRATEAFKRLNLDIDVSKPLNRYSIAVQQMVAIARALDIRARVLVLDEPTSSLDAQEVAKLFEVMRSLRAEGMGILFVSHFLDQVYEVSDRLTVLRNGALVGEYAAAELPRLQLIEKMIGKEVAENVRSPRSEAGEVVLEAKNVGARGSVSGLDVALRQGEVVGLGGLLGSGRTESAKLLFGADRIDEGSVLFHGKPVRFRSPRAAISRRIGFCPEDRKSEALIPNLSVRENIALALQSRQGWLKRLPLRRRRELADKYIRALGISTADAESPVDSLSGGNQQKVVLARWLASEPQVLILDEPTRGIDVGAKAEIEKLVASLAADGVAVLFISSEIDEVVRACDRVVVLRDRRKVGELQGEHVSPEAIMAMIAGAADA